MVAERLWLSWQRAAFLLSPVAFPAPWEMSHMIQVLHASSVPCLLGLAASPLPLIKENSVGLEGPDDARERRGAGQEKRIRGETKLCVSVGGGRSKRTDCHRRTKVEGEEELERRQGRRGTEGGPQRAGGAPCWHTRTPTYEHHGHPPMSITDTHLRASGPPISLRCTCSRPVPATGPQASGGEGPLLFLGPYATGSTMGLITVSNSMPSEKKKMHEWTFKRSF